jgi:peptide/nickel transport system permease protein
MTTLDRMPQKRPRRTASFGSESLGTRITKLWLFLRQNPLAALGLGMILVILLGSILAPVLTPYGPIVIDIKHKLEAPSLQHPLGTDFFGRDVLSRILYGGRNTLSIGVLVIGLAFVAGVPIGLLSGFVGGALDSIIMRVVDALLSFPALVLAIALAAALGPSLTNAMLAIALTLTPQFARVARGQALSIRAMPYIEAATSVGVSGVRALFYHVLPNSIGPLVVQATLSVGSAILQTASLGFLGLGAQPPMPEWGADVAANSQFLRESPWVAIFPGLAILLSVLAFNLFGDALVDWLNPRTRKNN